VCPCFVYVHVHIALSCHIFLWIAFFAMRCYTSATYVVMRCLSKRINISSIFFFTVRYPSHSSFFRQTASQYSDRGRIINGGSKAGGVGSNRDCNGVAAATARCCQHDCWLISGYRLLSTDGSTSSGVSQSWCKSVYGTECHAPVNKRKRT